MSAAADDPAPAIEGVFSRIAATAMADLPLNNPALRVEAVGFRIWQENWVGILITPWAINLMLMPGGASGFAALPLGRRQTWTFPSGSYEFMGGSDDELGPYQFCSLFSPTFEFVTHGDARATAVAALVALFDGAAAAEVGAERARMEGRPLVDVPLSRRGFLRGGVFGRRE